jgi:large subunit ribosomal protein L18
MDKKQARIRRAARARAKIRELGIHRLCVFRTPRHMYAQVIEPGGGKVVASASTVEKQYRQSSEGSSGNTSAAAAIGKVIAERARSAGIESVAFDRSGFRYHGRVKALAEAAREGGLKF